MKFDKRQFDRMITENGWIDEHKPITIKKQRVKFIFAWYDLWIGFFWDSKKKWLYFFPIPCFGIIFKFKL